MAETFAELFAHIGEFRGETEEQGRAWMWTVARHQLYRWRERGIVERRCLERIGVPVAALGPAEYERIEELADLQRLAPLLERALDGLGEDQREALRLRILEQREYDAIAARAGRRARRWSGRACRAGCASSRSCSTARRGWRPRRAARARARRR